MTTDILPTGGLLVTPIFRWGEAVLSLLRRSYVLPWPGTMPGAAHPKTRGSMTLFTSALNFACTHAQLPCITKHKAPSLEATKPITLSTQSFSKTGVGSSQCSLHNAPIFRLLLKVAVNGTHQCESLNFCGDLCPNQFSESVTLGIANCRARRAAGPPGCSDIKRAI